MSGLVIVSFNKADVRNLRDTTQQDLVNKAGSWKTIAGARDILNLCKQKDAILQSYKLSITPAASKGLVDHKPILEIFEEVGKKIEAVMSSAATAVEAFETAAKAEQEAQDAERLAQQRQTEAQVPEPVVDTPVATVEALAPQTEQPADAVSTPKPETPSPFKAEVSIFSIGQRHPTPNLREALALVHRETVHSDAPQTTEVAATTPSTGPAVVATQEDAPTVAEPAAALTAPAAESPASPQDGAAPSLSVQLPASAEEERIASPTPLPVSDVVPATDETTPAVTTSSPAPTEESQPDAAAEATDADDVVAGIDEEELSPRAESPKAPAVQTTTVTRIDVQSDRPVSPAATQPERENTPVPSESGESEAEQASESAPSREASAEESSGNKSSQETVQKRKHIPGAGLYSSSDESDTESTQVSNRGRGRGRGSFVYRGGRGAAIRGTSSSQGNVRGRGGIHASTSTQPASVQTEPATAAAGTKQVQTQPTSRCKRSTWAVITAPSLTLLYAALYYKESLEQYGHEFAQWARGYIAANGPAVDAAVRSFASQASQTIGTSVRSFASQADTTVRSFASQASETVGPVVQSFASQASQIVMDTVFPPPQYNVSSQSGLDGRPAYMDLSADGTCLPGDKPVSESMSWLTHTRLVVGVALIAGGFFMHKMLKRK